MVSNFFQKTLVQVTPGEFSATRVKSAGKVSSQSAIIHATPFIGDVSLLAVARALQSGPGRTIELWRIPFPY